MPAETHVARGPIDPDDLAILVRELVADTCGLDAGSITPATPLGEAALPVAAALEDELGERTVGLRLDDDDVADLLTVGDLVELVLERIGASGG